MSTSPKIDSTYGSAFIGLVAGSVLYGVTLLQTYLYYKQYPKDSIIIKFLVFFVWVLDTTHLILCGVAMYWYLITNFSNETALTKTTWSMDGLIGLIVECFFARRLWIMSGNLILTAIIVLLACIHFGLGIVEGFLLVETNKFPELIWVTSAGLGSAAAADIIIACSLCYYLSKSRTGFSRTDSLITTLTVYSLTTGLITSVIASIAVVTFATMPTNFVWLAFFWVLGKCYVNSLLAALNSRGSLREKVAPHDLGTFNLQLSPFRAMTSQRSMEESSSRPIVPEADSKTTRSPTLAVNVHTQTISKSDYLESPISAASSSKSFV
ncbi:hypothetical protein BD779DRAFT_726215 [Infundibulicybe gibba]|nr:hypothetical protein BD779DRAFT_726215 [Infundibulicybe gibba]